MELFRFRLYVAWCLYYGSVYALTGYVLLELIFNSDRNCEVIEWILIDGSKV